jgi:hypothetical protein
MDFEVRTATARRLNERTELAAKRFDICDPPIPLWIGAHSIETLALLRHGSN